MVACSGGPACLGSRRKPAVSRRNVEQCRHIFSRCVLIGYPEAKLLFNRSVPHKLLRVTEVIEQWAPVWHSWELPQRGHWVLVAFCGPGRWETSGWWRSVLLWVDDFHQVPPGFYLWHSRTWCGIRWTLFQKLWHWRPLLLM